MSVAARSRLFAPALALSGLAAVALTVNAAIGVRNVGRLSATEAWVRHTHEVLESLQAIRAGLVDAETGERGFLVAGEPAYLEPYRSGVAGVERRLAQLGQLIRDNPEQAGRLEAVSPLVARLLSHLERTVEARRGPGGFEAARALLVSGEAKALMDELREHLARMADEEQALLARRTQASTTAARETVVSLLAGLGAALVLLALALAAFRRRVSERERAAQALHAEKERFRTTLTSIGDAVIVTDAAGRITMLNPTAEALTGWVGEEALSRPLPEIFRIVNEQSRRPVKSPVEKVLREGGIVGLANHTVLLRRDGAELPIDDSGAPVRGPDGQIAGVVLVFRDVSERREGERRSQRQAEELREQDRRKDEFLAVLAHELRNPLAPIRNAVAVLRLAPPGGERARRAHEVIDRQASQMTRLVDDLLDIARITVGKIRLDRSSVRLDEVVQGAVDDHRELFRRRGVALELSGPGGEVWAMADATRLAQVVGNLLQNAAKFTSAGGRVRVSLETGGGQATLRVRDDGAGMDADTLERLFQPFVQANRTLARTQGGLGLGLALARSLVELQGGTITASSPGIGRGTELLVKLPLADPPRARDGDGALLAGARRRVLLIEDNEDAADTLRDALELDGHEVVVARDGHEGLDAAQAQDPEVVLCDLGLPGLDGFEVARRLRAAGSRAYLVALTGYATPEDAERALGAGFDAHLAKPADLGKLEALLAGAPSSERVVSPGPWSAAEPREHL